MDMFEDPLDTNTPTLLRPLDIDINTPTQPEVHSRHQGRDEGVGTFQDPIPGGGSILVKGPAGTSISLNLGIDPSSGTPTLSGRAINSQGEVLDVHPCSCSDPVSPYHRLPLLGSLELTHGEAHARDNNHFHASPKSQSGVHRRPAPIFTQSWTPLIVVHIQLPHLLVQNSTIMSRHKAQKHAMSLCSALLPQLLVQYNINLRAPAPQRSKRLPYTEGAIAPPTPLELQYETHSPVMTRSHLTFRHSSSPRLLNDYLQVRTSLHRVLSLPSHHFWCRSTASPP
ncbi:hypothetical protein BGW80DRAFT_915756 [Lactifluus volemus]|nr:hypothetical protein BGW80DRAFT_915756 [Lactifluus volemus]